jgi:rhomboid protease GluP
MEPIAPLFRLPVLLMALLLASLLPEAVLTLADHGLLGSPRWREVAYQNGAFWAGLLRDWRPNFTAQPVTMFATHAFLHAGPVHLIGNLLVLVLMWQRLMHRWGSKRLLVIYALSVLGGGAGFALLSNSPYPMVGASGAIFGLAAVAVMDRRRSHLDRLGLILALIALNVVVWWWQDGLLAWQTHLGGFVAGAVAAAVIGPQRPILKKIRA